MCLFIMLSGRCAILIISFVVDRCRVFALEVEFVWSCFSVCILFFPLVINLVECHKC